ncbi:hypothetical protein DNTS_029987 [Danionella cerebrum]|uniref:Translation initiation factor 3 N-terminal domain-containing protein n=1 Tax=Danionella cerebrum TaxID=2873325 RepID=A0A553QFR2_9TELE|nr:hypothetical protein DNTS_029987 [Danionella translucida]
MALPAKCFLLYSDRNHHHVQLLGADGEELGVKHRAEVFQLIDKTGLRLVIINDKCVPPIYRLMKGRDMFEERMKLKEQQKTKKDRAQLKEITISAGISPHDLEIKLKKAVKWLENKHHVKLRINGKRNNSTPLV